MTRTEAIMKVREFQMLIPEILKALETEERVPPRRFETAGYFRTVYKMSESTYQRYRDAINRQIQLGRYPSRAMQGRLVDKAVFFDYQDNRYALKHAPQYVPPYDGDKSFRNALMMEGRI